MDAFPAPSGEKVFRFNLYWRPSHFPYWPSSLYACSLLTQTRWNSNGGWYLMAIAWCGTKYETRLLRMEILSQNLWFFPIYRCSDEHATHWLDCKNRSYRKNGIWTHIRIQLWWMDGIAPPLRHVKLYFIATCTLGNIYCRVTYLNRSTNDYNGK